MTAISTRRFLALPAAVAFEATGFVDPMAIVSILSGAMPRCHNWRDTAIARFADLLFDIISPPHLAEQAYALAKRHGLGAIYDALYVALARDLDAELWTDDRRLRWIGDHPLP